MGMFWIDQSEIGLERKRTGDFNTDLCSKGQVQDPWEKITCSVYASILFSKCGLILSILVIFVAMTVFPEAFYENEVHMLHFLTLLIFGKTKWNAEPSQVVWYSVEYFVKMEKNSIWLEKCIFCESWKFRFSLLGGFWGFKSGVGFDLRVDIRLNGYVLDRSKRDWAWKKTHGRFQYRSL